MSAKPSKSLLTRSLAFKPLETGATSNGFVEARLLDGLITHENGYHKPALLPDTGSDLRTKRAKLLPPF